MFTQLNPPLPVFIVDRGKGLAMGVIDYGPEHHLIWVTALDENGKIWCAPNPKVRMQGNWTMGLGGWRLGVGVESEGRCRRLPAARN